MIYLQVLNSNFQQIKSIFFPLIYAIMEAFMIQFFLSHPWSALGLTSNAGPPYQTHILIRQL